MLRRLLDTVRPLRRNQLVWRLRRRIAPGRPPPPTVAPVLNLRLADWTEPLAKRPGLLADGRFHFLNETGSLAEDGWAAESRPALWRYNLHYFDFAGDPAAAARSDAIIALMLDWIARCPPGAPVAWDSYPLSLRIVNWIKFGLAKGGLPVEILSSLAHQARWLAANLEYDIRANHLFANAKALVFAGMALDGLDSQPWLATGRRLALEQLEEQFDGDGGHFELSPMYHAIMLEDLLDLENLARRSGDAELASAMAATAAPALGWLETLCHPDGEIAFFNDACFGNAPTPEDLNSYAARLGHAPAGNPAGSRRLDCGYVRLGAGDAVLLADIAAVGPDCQPGHAHADILSFEFSLGDERIVVNSGTSRYGAGIERQRQRGTAAHSTLVLDGCDSSEVWGGFRVGRRARARIEAFAPNTATGSHDGFRFLSGSPVHRRRWTLTEDSLTIEDFVISGASHEAEMTFHLHPGVRLIESASGLRLTTQRGRSLEVQSDRALEVRSGTWHPEFGASVPNLRLVARWLTTPGGGGACTRLRWSDS